MSIHLDPIPVTPTLRSTDTDPPQHILDVIQADLEQLLLQRLPPSIDVVSVQEKRLARVIAAALSWGRKLQYTQCSCLIDDLCKQLFSRKADASTYALFTRNLKRLYLVAGISSED